MKAAELRQLFRDGGKRFAVVGDEERGAIVGLDLEARIFALRDGEVVNRVNPDAVTGRSDRQGYFNPGGDGLWPAPEGTSLGYEYATGAWEVPSGLVSARFFVEDEDTQKRSLCVGGEVALVNNRGLGLPTRFRRTVTVGDEGGVMKLCVVESIVYRGTRQLSADEARLAPWSLCQFDVKAGDEARFRLPQGAALRDFYEPSDGVVRRGEDGVVTAPAAARRYQVAVGDEVSELTLYLASQQLKIRRITSPALPGTRRIDIADSDPAKPPIDVGVRYSVYNDVSGFMEIEAAGAVPDVLTPGVELSMTVLNEISPL